MRRALPFFLALALLYCGAGLLPGRVFAPVDLVSDSGAWKGDLVSRVRVSNGLLSDVMTQFVPWDAEVLRLGRNGQMPWRNRWAADGAPLFANPQTALLSPFTWPRLLFGDAGWAICAMLRIVAAGLSMTWLARLMGASPRAAVFSGFVYAASGYGVLWLLYPIANAFAVLPALAAAALAMLRDDAGAPSGAATRRPATRALLVTLFAALATIGGHPETLFCGVVSIAALLVWEARSMKRTRALVRPALAALAGFAICGVMLVPFFRLLWEGDARVVRMAASPFGFRWTALVAAVLPGFLGSPLKSELDLTALLSLPENFIIRSEAYVGFIVLVVLALTWHRLPPIFRRGLIVGVIGFAISLRLPGLRLIVHVFPIAVEYGTLAFVMFAAAAAGPALEALADDPDVANPRVGDPVVIPSESEGAGGLGDTRSSLNTATMSVSHPARPHRSLATVGRTMLVTGVLLAGSAFVVALPAMRPALATAARSGIARLRTRGVLHKPAEVYEQRLTSYLNGAGVTVLRRVLIPALCWAVAGVGLMRRRHALVAAAAAIELLAFGLGFNPAVERVRGIPPPIAQLHRLDPTHEYFAASHLEVFPSNFGTLYAVRDVVSYDDLQSRARIEALTAAGYDRVTQSIPTSPTPAQRSALASLGVRWLITPTGIDEIANAVHPSPPRNDPPEGLMAGLLVSAMGVLLAIGVMTVLRK